MKEVTIKIPENKLNFFIELVHQLGYEVTQNYEIPEEHMSIVRDRIKKSEENPERLESWDKVKNKFKFD
jgi:hypothetical protein